MAGLDSYVKLLLHCDGTDTSTSFPDSSASAHTVTANGDAQVDTAQSKFGGASGYFDGAGDYLSVPDHADWDFGSGDFTIDFWVRFNAITDNVVFLNQWDNGVGTNSAFWLFYSFGVNAVYFGYSYNSGSLDSKSFSWTPLTGQWYHVALSRNGSSLRAFVDGNQIGITESIIYAIDNSSRNLYIGAAEYNNVVDRQYLNGWLEELRVSNGIARWTSNFTPPTAAYILEYPIVAAGESTTVGTLDIIEMYILDAVGSSTTSGFLGYAPTFIPIAESQSSGMLELIYGYIFDYTGSSTSTGFFNINGQYIHYGSSTTLGTLLLVRWTIIATGTSDSSGITDVLHHRFRELAGESSSLGDMPLHRDIPLSAESSTGGLDMLQRLLLYIGSSESSGTLTLSEIEALEALACYLINLDTKRTRQYTNYAFTGIGRFNGKMLASFADGIYDLDTETIYDGVSTEIPASMEIKTDFGMANYKSIRAVYVDDDKTWVTITDSDGDYIKHDISPSGMRSIKKDMRDMEFTIKIENISGSNITLRRLHGKLNVLQRKGV